MQRNYKLLCLLLICLLYACENISSHKESINNDSKNIAFTKEAINSDTIDRFHFFHQLAWVSEDSLAQVITLADSIMAYNWNDHQANTANVDHYIVDPDGKLNDQISTKILLTKPQAKQLRAILIDTTNFQKQNSNASCFIPHISFIYYRESKVIGQSNVCFLCASVRSIPKLSNELNEKGSKVLKKYCASLGLKIYDADSDLKH